MLQMYIHYISTLSALTIHEILLYLKNVGVFLLQIILIFKIFINCLDAFKEIIYVQ
jgi:hypothetical protein